MQSKKFLSQYLLLLGLALAAIVAFTSSCANIGEVTGGLQDTIPPKIIRETPANFTLQFDAKQIELVFDEYLKPGGFAQQFIVSPPFKNKPEFKLAGKKLTLIINDTLQENATYALSFGNGLADLNEGNAIKGYKYVFSTGNHIDSLAIKGAVKGIEAISKYDDFIAMLFPIDSLIIDSVPLQKLPLYYSKLDEQGQFEIEYLKEDFFRLLVIEDKNGNFKYDPGTDAVAFFPDSIPAGAELEMPLLVFTEDKASMPQSPRTRSPYEIVVSFTAPYDSVIAYTLSTDYEIIAQQRSKNRDSLTIFLDKPIVDSLYVVLRRPEKSDTLKAKLGSQKMPNWTLKSSVSQSLNPNDSLLIQSSQPILGIDSSKVLLTTLSADNEENTLSYQMTIDENRLLVNIHFERKIDSKYKLTLLPGALNSYATLKHDTLINSFITKKKEDLGLLVMKIEMDSILPVFIELSDTKGNLILKDKLAQGSYTLRIDNMEPGSYKLKAVYDRNQNIRWDTGNYLKALQPEEILNYPEDIQLRANWDLDLEWKVGF